MLVARFDDGADLVALYVPWLNETIWKLGGVCVIPRLADEPWQTAKTIRGGITVAVWFSLHGKVYYITKEEFEAGLKASDPEQQGGHHGCHRQDHAGRQADRR